MQLENVSIRYLTVNPSEKKPFSNVVDLSKGFRKKSNSEFFAEVRKRVEEFDETNLTLNGRTYKNGLRAAIGLIGEYGLIGYTIRQAQSIIRLDKQPSYWSHSFIFYDEVPKTSESIMASGKKAPLIWESTMDITGAIPQLNFINGVSPRYLRDYNKSDFDVFSPHCVPNAAVIIIALTSEEADMIIERASQPSVDQLRYDFSGLLGTWLSYILNKKNEENPLGTGNSVYCSAYCQLAYDAVKLDLATGITTRNTSPESIWQSAKYFSTEFERNQHPIMAYYCVRDPRCELIPFEHKSDIKTSLTGVLKMLKK